MGILSCVALVLVAGQPQPAAQNADDGVRQQAISDWADITESISAAEWQMESTVFTGHEEDKYKISSSSITKVSLRTEMVSWANQINPTAVDSKLAKLKTEVLLNNSDYESALIGAGATPDHWVLKTIITDPTPVKASALRFARIPWLNLCGVRLDFLFSSKSFTLTRIESGFGGEGLCRIDFTYTAPTPEVRGLPGWLNSGHVVIDRAHRSRPVSYEYLTDTPNTKSRVRGIVTYDTKSDLPTPLKIETYQDSQSTRKGKIFGKELHEYQTVYYNRNFDDARFYLKYYNIPEPAGSQPRSRKLPNSVYFRNRSRG